jgi:hypothetical protein
MVLDRVKEAEPFFTSVSIYRRVATTVPSQTVLPNACVPSCLAQMARLLMETGMPDEAGLVFFFYDPLAPSRELAPGIIGHCVLVYRYRDQWFCLDPRYQESPKPLTQVAIGAHLDPTLGVLAKQPDYRLEHARLLVIPPRTLRQLNTDLTWKLWSERAGKGSGG